jgi:hypothetical protein
MSERWYEYDFASLRLVPRVHRAECRNLGVMVFSPNATFLAGRFVNELAVHHAESIDVDLVNRYLRNFDAILRGEPEGGPIARLPISRRFHWLTAPRSDILQPGPVHHGRCHDLEACLEDLFSTMVDA